MFTIYREMGNIEEVVRIRKTLESLIETPENIPAEAPVHIDELVNIYYLELKNSLIKSHFAGKHENESQNAAKIKNWIYLELPEESDLR